MSGATHLRFWGKILGINKDYFIVEGHLLDSEEENNDPISEQRGQGINKQVYWVTDNVLEDWVQLPDVHPSHIDAARHVK